MTRPDQHLLRVVNLCKEYRLAADFPLGPPRRIRAVDNVNFTIERGKTFSLVGESGCGKTTTGRAILRLIEPDSGEVWLNGRNLLLASRRELRGLRQHVQTVFQDPYGSLNPRMTVGQHLLDVLGIHRFGPRQERTARAKDMLTKVGLSPDHLHRYPHEFSGGQRQRISIARALILNPDLIVGDEPVSALDVSIQAQITNLLKDLQAQFGVTYLLISHNLSFVQYISDTVAVMYLGKIVVTSDTRSLFHEPLHPYTENLLAAVPSAKPGVQRRRMALRGEAAAASTNMRGCRFSDRCPYSQELCKSIDPPLRVAGPDRYVACHYPLS